VTALLAAFVTSSATAVTTRELALDPNVVDLVVCKRLRASGDCLVKDEYPRRNGEYVVPRGKSYWLWWRLRTPKSGFVQVFTYSVTPTGEEIFEDRDLRKFRLRKAGFQRWWVKWAWTENIAVRHYLSASFKKGTLRKATVRIG